MLFYRRAWNSSYFQALFLSLVQKCYKKYHTVYTEECTQTYDKLCTVIIVTKGALNLFIIYRRLVLYVAEKYDAKNIQTNSKIRESVVYPPLPFWKYQ